MSSREKRPCPYCPKKSFRSDHWRRHMNSVHPGMATELPVRVRQSSQHLRNDGSSLPTSSVKSSADQAVMGIDSDSQSQNANLPGRCQETQTELYIKHLTVETDNSGLRTTKDGNEHVQRDVPGDNLGTTLIQRIRTDILGSTLDQETQCMLSNVTLQCSEPNENETEHILNCSQCWSKISPDVQSFHWLGECLIAAVQHNNLPLVRHLLNLGSIAHYTNSDGDSALHLAIDHRCNGLGIITLLCEEGSALNIKNKEGYTPLTLACWEGHEGSMFRDSPVYFSIIKTLLDSGADPNISLTARSFTNFLGVRSNGCKDEYLKYLEIFVSRLKDINPDGSNAWDLKVMLDDVASVRILLKYGANPWRPDVEGNIPLIHASSLEMAKCLLDAWPESGRCSSDELINVLEEQVREGRYEIVELIINRKPQLLLDCKTNDRFLLHYTWGKTCYCEYEHYRTREVLLEAGYDVNMRDDKGNTAFHEFAKFQVFPFFKFANNWQFMIAGKHVWDEQRVMSSSLSVWLKSANLLKEYDADINAINKKGESPLGILLGSLVEVCKSYRIQESKDRFRYLLANQISNVASLGFTIHTIMYLGGMLTPQEKSGLQNDVKSYGGVKGLLSDFIASAIESCRMMDPEMLEDRSIYNSEH